MEKLNANKLHLNFIEKNLFQFFNSLPQDVPGDWLISCFNIYEDLQYLPYMFSSYFFSKLRSYITNAFTIFDPYINSPLYFFPLFFGLIILIFYIYFMLIYHIGKGNERKISNTNLRIFNSIYVILFRYDLLFVFNFFAEGLRICDFSGYVSGIPECDSNFSLVINIISALCLGLIFIYNMMYNFFSINTNYLSHGKFFGTFYYLNNNKLLIVKLFLALFSNYISIELEIDGLDHKYISYIFAFMLVVGFGFIAFKHLKYQPYYSAVINNYRFGIYFSYCVFSLFLVLVLATGLSDSQFIADVSPFIVIILFGIGYKINNMYYKMCIRRVYKKLQEKETVSNLRKTLSSDELKFNPTKLQKKNIYKSIERITQETYIKKEIKIFKNFNECEIACRFLRYNRNIEAFMLMKKLFEEGIIQFKHEAYIYILAWYYIYYMKRFYRDNNLIKKYKMELFDCENLLSDIKDLKLNARKKFLIYKTEEYIDLERRENSLKNDTGNCENSIKYEELKFEAIKTHIQGLRAIKNLFTTIRNTTNTKEITSSFPIITQLSNYQISASSKYRNIIRQFPDAKNILKVYVSFLTDVMDKDELAFKYMNEINKISDKNSNNDSPNEESQKLISPVSFEEKKATFVSQNSLVSYSHSEDMSASSGMGKEVRKKINAKNLMTNKFVLPIKKLQKNMLLCIALYIIIFIAQIILTMVSVKRVTNYSNKINKNINVPMAISQSALNVRLLSYNLILNDYRDYGKHISALKNNLMYLDDLNMAIINEEMSNLETDGSLIVPVGYYSFDTYESGLLGDSYTKMVVYLKYCMNREMLKANETVYDILYEPHFRYFIVNSMKNFNSVFDLCKRVLSDKIIGNLNLLNIIVICLCIVLVLLSLAVGYIMLIPLESSSNKIMYNSLRMFRFFSKDNLEQIINSYDEKIESLCQMLDIDKEMNENERKHDSKKSKQKIILGGTIAVIIIYIIITAIPVINTKKNVSDILSLIQESSDRLTLIGGINLFTYEVVNNDRSIFLDNEPKRILKDYISQLRKKQDSIKYGSYGGPSFDAYPSLDYLLKDNGCHRLENVGSSCDSVIYDSSYGFSEELATLPINELIYEYLLNVEQFINDVDNDKYAIVPFTNRENIKMIYDQIVDSDFFKLQSGLIDNIVGDIQFIDSELIKLTIGMVDEFYDTMIIIVGVGIVLIFFIVIFILNKLFVKKIKEMNTFISFLFLVPPSIVNKNEKYKRFLETTQTDD